MSKKLKDRKVREWDRKVAALASDGPSNTPAPSPPSDVSLSVTALEPAEPPAMRVPIAERCWLLVVPLALLGLMLVLTFRPITQNDFWMHLRIGEDILDTFEVPRVDQYSAVAVGRPFIAHEWLSGVMLALVGAAFGPHGFTVMAEAIAAVIATLLFFAVPSGARSSPLLLPLGLLAAYTTAFRLAIRPDLFTMLLLAVWAFAIERWRSSRNLYFLALLVPLITLWANLHGAFLFGVALLVLLALLVGADRALGGLQKTGEVYSPLDLRQVAAVAACGVVACLLNPQGWQLPLFSLNMTAGQDFEQVRAVTEWQPTFDTESYFFQNFHYLAYACGAWLLVLWLGLLLRLPEAPVFDVAIAAVVTYLSVRQNRFIPYSAIFGFPIALRSWHGLFERHLGAAYAALTQSRILKVVSVLVVAGATAVTVQRGFVLSAQSSQALGWGFGARHPEQEANYIKEQGLEGVLYNERMPDGAYLIRTLFPKVRPVMDMRLDVYGKELCDEYDGTKSSREALNRYVQKYNVRLALVNRAGWIEDHFRRALGFVVVYQGSERSVMVKRW